jgi:hypothetical protein
MPRGGKRTGAGRPKGAVNKATAEAKAAVEASGETPLDYMIRVMRDPKANARRRDAMAAAAAPYVHHRLSSTEHSGPGDGPVQVIVQTGFAYGDGAGVKNGAEKPARAGGA